MTPLRRILNDLKSINNNNDIVQVPTGSKYSITHTGEVVVLKNHTLKNVLYIPDIKFNLLSVSKITKELCCSVNFYPEFFIFQRLYNGKVMGIGKEYEGLYWLQEEEAIKAGAVIKDQQDPVLWHNRLGHPSVEVLNKISDLRVKMDHNT